MITVAGEALIDLIIDPAGHVDPRLGGGPFNVTRAVARLDQPVAFLGRLSGDRFGRLMRADLDRHGVLVAIEAPTDAPTTLALVTWTRPACPATTSTWPAPRPLRSGPARRRSRPTPRRCTSAASVWSWSRSGPARSTWWPNCPAASRSCSTRTADPTRSPRGRPTWTGSAACCAGWTWSRPAPRTSLTAVPNPRGRVPAELVVKFKAAATR